jgi:hypothetical protein
MFSALTCLSWLPNISFVSLDLEVLSQSRDGI